MKEPVSNTRTRLLVWGVCVSLALLVALAFGQVVRFQFVNYDDNLYVARNPMVLAGPTWRGIVWALTYAGADYWHPLTWWSHMIDSRLFGLWAGGHHLSNVLLHGLSAILLFLAVRGMTGSLWRSAFVAALFA